MAETVAAVSLRDLRLSAPASWQPQVATLTVLGERLALPPTVYGALLWQHLTELPYLHAGSDIDLLWSTPAACILPSLLDDLARLDAAGPARVDGEITLASGCGVNWRELRQELPSPGGSVLVKSMNGAGIRCAQTLFS
ncbi:MAG: malonate decarboxylase holo-[acyl-carrier-protein] synthase [Rhodospirillales bacterium]